MSYITHIWQKTQQDVFRLKHQFKIIYSKMDKQYINILNAPKLDIGLYM